MQNDIQKVESEALAWPDKAREIVITNQEGYDYAIDVLKIIASIMRNIKEHHAPIKKAAKEAHTISVAAENKFLKPLADANIIVRQTISAWTTEQARLRQAEQKRLDDIARKQAEDERLKLALEAEDAGMPGETVEEIIEHAEQVYTPTAKATFVKDDKVSTRKTWAAEVIDIKLLCKAIVDGKVPATAIMPNMLILNGLARQQKENFDIPGVRAVSKDNISLRS